MIIKSYMPRNKDEKTMNSNLFEMNLKDAQTIDIKVS